MPEERDRNTAEVGPSIRERVDPDHTLPMVALKVSADNIPIKGILITTKYDIIHLGQKMGWVNLTVDKKIHTAHFAGIEVNESVRGKGKGFGLSTYLEAIEMSLLEGNTFETHEWSQTAGAKRIWEILAAKGVAKEIEPFVPDGFGRFNGKYVINP